MEKVQIQNTLLLFDIMENRDIPCGSSLELLNSNKSKDFNWK